MGMIPVRDTRDDDVAADVRQAIYEMEWQDEPFSWDFPDASDFMQADEMPWPDLDEASEFAFAFLTNFTDTLSQEAGFDSSWLEEELAMGVESDDDWGFSIDHVEALIEQMQEGASDEETSLEIGQSASEIGQLSMKSSQNRVKSGNYTVSVGGKAVAVTDTVLEATQIALNRIEGQDGYRMIIGDERAGDSFLLLFYSGQQPLVYVLRAYDDAGDLLTALG